VKKEIESSKKRLKRLDLNYSEAEKLLGYAPGSIKSIFYSNSSKAINKLYLSLKRYERVINNLKRVDRIWGKKRVESLKPQNMKEKELIENILNISGLTRKELAHEIGLSKSALYAKKLGKSTIKALEHYYLLLLTENLLMEGKNGKGDETRD